MQEFLQRNRDELIKRCEAKVARRPRRAATAEQLKNGVPIVLDQLIRTLKAENEGRFVDSLRISGESGDSRPLSEIGVSATAHGKQLLELGYTVDQVVHDYGDLCQSITDLAVERDMPFSVDNFRTMNRCLDNAIADAVTEFSAERDALRSQRQAAIDNERLGSFVHELRNSLHSGTLAYAALEAGQLSIAGATGAVVRRSLVGLKVLIDQAVEEARTGSAASSNRETFLLAVFLAEAGDAALLEARSWDCLFTLRNIGGGLQVNGDRELLLAALSNLLRNAFKFTLPHTDVLLCARVGANVVYIDVEDRCGGLPPGAGETMFSAFAQHNENKSGLGLGLSIARSSVEAAGGILSVRDVPGTGCVFTIRLPLHPERAVTQMAVPAAVH